MQGQLEAKKMKVSNGAPGKWRMKSERTDDDRLIFLFSPFTDLGSREHLHETRIGNCQDPTASFITGRAESVVERAAGDGAPV